MLRSAKMLFAGLSLATLVFAAPVRAEDAPKAPEKPAKRDGANRPAPGKVLDDALASVNLNDDQKKMIDPIVAKLHDDIKAILADQTVKGPDRRTKVQDVMKTAKTDIESNLTADQKTAFDKYLDEHKPADRGGKKGDGAKKGGDNKPAN